MSAAVRNALSAAASSVAGISVTPYFRQATKPGDGMVRLDRMIRDANGFGFVNTWQVFVLLPQDLTTAEKYMESKTPALLEVLGAEMVIVTVTPQELILENGVKLPVVVIEGNREQE